MVVAVSAKVISRGSKDHVLVNFLSGANCCDKSFQLISSRPAFSLQGFRKRAVLVLSDAKSGVKENWKC